MAICTVVGAVIVTKINVTADDSGVVDLVCPSLDEKEIADNGSGVRDTYLRRKPVLGIFRFDIESIVGDDQAGICIRRPGIGPWFLDDIYCNARSIITTCNPERTAVVECPGTKNADSEPLTIYWS